MPEIPARKETSVDTALSALRYCREVRRLPYNRCFVEFATPNDEQIKLLFAKLLRAENPSVIMQVAEQLKIAIDTYVREHTYQIPAIKEFA